VILGSTYTGHYEPVEEVSKLLDEYEKETGIDIPIHVDGASGAMFCPFATPSVKFGFTIPRVKSINAYVNPFAVLMVAPDTSMVSFIPVLAGSFGAMRKNSLNILNLNCIILEVMPPSDINVTLGVEETYTLNFSRPGAHVVAQYYNFIHLGFDGYAAVQRKSLVNARILSLALEATRCMLIQSHI
jgi:glutamate decarboxylase